jgi:alpha-beta hydrolase superfamily lysophospholipase
MRLLRLAKRLFSWASLLVIAVLLGVIVLRSLGATRGPPLESWHTFAPDEWSVEEMDESTWPQWLAKEGRLFAKVREQIGPAYAEEDRESLNRFAPASFVNPHGFKHDWNRSFELEPEGEPRGVAVMLHGLSDSPYSLRHIAQHYRDRGFLVLAIRMPGHGTTPAGLIHVGHADWLAATRLAMREAEQRRPPGAPLHVVGYSNGAALALLYSLEADRSPAQPLPTQLVLLSPMIGVEAYARFAGIAGLPAILPAFAKAAWLDVLPEFNPFKYNSFPVHAARESWVLTRVLHSRLADPARAAQLPPMLVFQSVLDGTVTVSAVSTRLMDLLPDNGSELVLFDVNRAAHFERLLRVRASIALGSLLPRRPARYGITIVTAADPRDGTRLRIRPPGTMNESERALDAPYPADMYSLSHVALPFPPTDSLYGIHPGQPGEFGLDLGTIKPRGERGVLLMSLDSLMRASSNPFYEYMIGRIDQTLPPATTATD